TDGASAEALRGAARAAAAQGDRAHALAYWRRVLDASPPGGTAWYEARVAQVTLLAEDGQKAQACELLRAARGRATSAGGDQLEARLREMEPRVCRGWAGSEAGVCGRGGAGSASLRRRRARGRVARERAPRRAAGRHQVDAHGIDRHGARRVVAHGHAHQNHAAGDRHAAQVERRLLRRERVHQDLEAAADPRLLDVRMLHQLLEAVAEAAAEVVVREDGVLDRLQDGALGVAGDDDAPGERAALGAGL